MLKTHIVNFSFDQQTLKIEWGDGHNSTFHYVWLRDNAPENRHTNGQKLIETTSIPLEVTARAITVDRTVRIEWTDIPTVSEFEPGWLRTHAYEQSEVALRRWRPSLWKAEDLVNRLPEFSYMALIQNDKMLRDMLAMVHKLGFVIIHDVPTVSESLFKVVDLFGYVRETNYGTYFDVKAVPNPSNLAFTGLTLTGHTDNPYRHPVPTLQLLHFLNNNVDGGDSTLVDGFKVAETLRQEAPDKFELLATSPVTFRFQSDKADLSHETTIISTDLWGDVNGIAFNNRSMQALNLPPEKTKAFYVAYQTFGQMLEADTYKITVKLADGDLVLCDNERVLHGRIGYTSAGQQRHAQGCYADRDSLLSKLAVLSRL